MRPSRLRSTVRFGIAHCCQPLFRRLGGGGERLECGAHVVRSDVEEQR